MTETRERTDFADSLSIVLKVAERCNIACTYCYFFYSGDESYKRHPATIPAGTVEDLCRFLKGASVAGVRDIRVGFHGGEPLLLKKDRLVAICEQLKLALEPDCQLTLVVQTNAMLIDEEWIAIFERFQIRLGVSFDGPQEVHDVARLDKKGRGTYLATVEGWNRLKEAAAQGRMSEPGILCVVDPQYSGSEIFNHFVDVIGARGINFLLPDLSHDSDVLSPEYVESCGKYLIDVFEAWKRRGDPNIRVRFITEIFGPLVNDEFCRQSLSHKNSPFGQIVVSSNGDICPDDTIRGLNERFQQTDLSVAHNDIMNVWSSDLWREMAGSNEVPPTACQACQWWSLCKGGTMHHRYSASQGFNNASVFCQALKMLYGHVYDSLVASKYDPAVMNMRLAHRAAPATAAA